MACHVSAHARTPAFAGCVTLLALAVAGCGGNKTPVASDSVRVLGVVSGLHEAAMDAKNFQLMFAEGAAPKDSERERYKQYEYEAKAPSVSGSTATATVIVRDPRAGKILGEAEWTAVKVGDAWKLQSAPLPAAAK